MRLGILALLLSVGLLLPGSPAQAREKPDAKEVVQGAIDDLNDLVAAARRLDDPDDRAAMTTSFERDRAPLRELRTSLRGDPTGAERRYAAYVARSTLACSTGKVAYGLRGPSRVEVMLAHNVEAAENVRDAHDPEAAEAAEIEELLASAAYHRGVASAHLARIVPAAARIRCARPDASLGEVAQNYQAAEDAAVSDRDAVERAMQLIPGWGDVIEAD